MRDLDSPDAKQYSQYLRTGNALCKHRVEAGTALLDEGKVKTGGVCNGLSEIRDIHRLAGIWLYIVIGAWDSGVSIHAQSRNGVGKCIPEVRVLGTAAIASPPTRVDGELHQVGEASDLLSTCGFTTGKGAELVEVGYVRALRSQVRVDELLVGQLVFGVVVNVLRHIAVELLEGEC